MSTPRHLPTDGPRRQAGRKKLTTDVGRTIQNRERRRLAREQAQESQDIVDEYRRQAKQRQEILTNATKPSTQMKRAIDRGLIKRLAGVMASEDLDVRLRATQVQGAQSSAWTDFRNIEVYYATFTDAKGNPDYRLIAANLRGLAYHEAGHCRWTIPFPTLVEQVQGVASNRFDHLHKAWNFLEDQRMETAVVSDSPAKAKYLLPMVMQHNCPDVSMLAANYPLLVWRKYLPSRLRQQARRLFMLAHPLMTEERTALMEQIIEDYVLATDVQTMFSRVQDFHDLYTNYINPVIPGDDSHDRGRTTPQGNTKPDDDMLLIPIDPGMLQDDDDGDDGEGFDAPDEPVPTSSDDLSPEELEHLAEVFHWLYRDPSVLVRIGYYDPTAQPEAQEDDGPPQPGSPPDDQGGDESDEDDEDATDSDGSQSGSDSVENDTDDGDEGTSDDADGQGQDEGDDAEHGDEGTGAGSDASDTEGSDDDDSEYDEPITDDELEQMLQDAEDERNADRNLDVDERSMYEAASEFGSSLTSYDNGVRQDNDLQTRADNLAYEVEQAFHAATMDKAPQWVEQQNRGILNVLRYETRQPGQTDFCRQWTDDDAPGLNIAVSVLLDYSSSMMSHADELSAAGFACKRACDRLEVPCTVTLWNTDARLLWDHYDKVDALPAIQPAGGTNPGRALDDLFVQRFDKPLHIVIIMTDGQWNGTNTPGAVTPYLSNGTLMIGLAYDPELTTAMRYAESMRSYGVPTVQAINTLTMIPRVMEQALAEATMMV